MALQVWLPLNKQGDLSSKGLQSGTFNLVSSPTYNASGKIGGCYSFDGVDDNLYLQADKTWWSGKEISYCCWFKCDKTTSGGVIIDLFADLTINYRYDSSGIKFGYWRCYSNNGTRTGDTATDTTYYSADVWHNIVVTFSKQYNRLYVDGKLSKEWDSSSKYTTNWVPLLSSSYKNIAIGRSYGSISFIGGLLNDVRIYDHCLSPAEVKEISRGLVLHYKLDDPLIGVEFYDYLQSTGTQWIDTGVKGYMNHTYEIDFQQSDAGNYRIWGVLGQSSYVGYNMSLTYGGDWLARWNSTSSGQSNVSLGAINTNRHVFKVVNGQCYFDNVSKGTSTGHNSNFSIDNNLFLFTINPANTTPSSNSKCKIYSYKDIDSNGKLVRDMVPCTYNGVAGMWDKVEEKFYGNSGTGTFSIGIKQSYNETIIDSSGYGNHGTAIDSLFTNSDTIRYNYSTIFNGTTNGVLIENLNIGGIINSSITYSFWIKPNGENGLRSVYFGSYSSASFSIEKDANNKLRLWWNGSPDLRATVTITDGQWQHIVIVKNESTELNVYLNGILAQTITNTFNTVNFPTTFRIGRDTRSNDGTPYKGLMSDFRIYATALSAEDVRQLYEVAGKVDNLGKFHEYEFIEELNTVPKILKKGIAIGSGNPNPNLISGSSIDAKEYTYPISDNYKDCFHVTTTIVPSASQYTLSFWAKSTVNGDKIRVHYYNPNTTTKCQSNQGITTTASDGQIDFTLSTEWQLYWVVYTQSETTTIKHLIVPRLGNPNGSSYYSAMSGSGTISVKMVKFEEGNVPTAWVPNSADSYYFNTVGFIEKEEGNCKIQKKGYFESNQFIEI